MFIKKEREREKKRRAYSILLLNIDCACFLFNFKCFFSIALSYFKWESAAFFSYSSFFFVSVAWKTKETRKRKKVNKTNLK